MQRCAIDYPPFKNCYFRFWGEIMINQLTSYYEINGILATNFHCPYYEFCVKGNSELITGKSAYIGQWYEENRLPRILFVSLDPGSDQSFADPVSRTPAGVRAIESISPWQTYNRLWHWHATHRLALIIAQQFKPELTEKDANLIFTHTNSAKCCVKKKGKDMSPGILYKNCRNFIAGELEILSPDVIVGQGSKAQEAVEYSSDDVSDKSDFETITQIHERIKMIMIKNHTALYIKMIYPTWRNARTIKQEKELYPYYLRAVNVYKEILYHLNKTG